LAALVLSNAGSECQRDAKALSLYLEISASEISAVSRDIGVGISSSREREIEREKEKERGRERERERERERQQSLHKEMPRPYLGISRFRNIEFNAFAVIRCGSYGLVQKGRFTGNTKHKLALPSQPVFASTRKELQTCLPQLAKY